MAEFAFHFLATTLTVALVWGAARSGATVAGPRALRMGAACLVAVPGLYLALAFGLARLADWRAFEALRLLAWGVFVHFPGLLVALALVGWRRERRRSAAACAVASAALVGVAIDAFFVEPQALVVTRHEVSSDEVDRPVRIVVVSDLQPEIVGAYEERALRTALAEAPDLLLFAGDYLHHRAGPERTVQLARMNRLMRDLDVGGTLGAVAVDGNCDLWDWQGVFERTRVRAVRGRTRMTFGPVTVTTLDQRESRTLRSLDDVPGFHVVLGHRPDFALGDIDADLLLAGHCHGGQVRLPFFGPPIILSRIPRRWSSGLHEIAPGRFLCVSRGVGMERGGAPLMRFRCRPEIVVIDVLPR